MKTSLLDEIDNRTHQKECGIAAVHGRCWRIEP
jgi:hypothetical protein